MRKKACSSAACEPQFPWLRAVIRYFPQKKSQGAVLNDSLSVEQLEPRILYSAAPVETPASEAETEVQATEQSPVAAAAAPTAVAVAETSPDVAPVVAVVPSDSAETEVAAEQSVALVDVDDSSSTLNQEVVETLAAEARQRWIDSGISAEQIAALDSVSYQIADVGGAHLGVANGFTITIDDDAGGTGVDNWFIDGTPGTDEEFGNVANSSSMVSALVESGASGRFDLLSTLIHEQGHVLGLEDIFAARENVMDGLLDAGTRRLPTEGQAEGAVAGSVLGDNFLTAHMVRASTDSAGAESNGLSQRPSISGNGRYVAFVSDATNLVTGDTNGKRDAFLKDLVTGNIVLISTGSAGNQANLPVEDVTISADGNFAIFSTSANNLVAGDTNSAVDVFRKDLTTGETIRVSTSSDGGQADLGSWFGSISADGRYVAFESFATDLVAGDTNGVRDAFVKDLVTGKVTRVSVDSAGVEGNAESADVAISGDGRHVAFRSTANNLAPGDSNGTFDVYVHNLITGATVLASSNTGGTVGDSLSRNPSISENGRYVAFESGADNLTTGVVSGSLDIFVKDLSSGVVTRASTDSSGGQVFGSSSAASISADGRSVAFVSISSTLVADDNNGTNDVFIKNLDSGAIGRVSSDSEGDGDEADGSSVGAAISADGRFVALSSDATNLDLALDDTNGVSDIFVKGVGSITGGFTTEIGIDDNGSLNITDVDGGDSKDRLFIDVVDGMLEIRDRGNVLGATAVGVVQVDAHTIRVPLALVAGKLLGVATFGGDDTITLSDLTGAVGGFSVNGGDDDDLITLAGSLKMVSQAGARGGDGDDMIRQTGVVEVTGSSDISYIGERIRLERGSSVSTDSTDIRLKANEFGDGVGSFTGLWASGSSIQTNSGFIILEGHGGTAGSNNRGIYLKDTDVTTTSTMFVHGFGGGTGSNNDGVWISGGTLIGSNVNIDGFGGDAGSGNRGVNILSGTTIEAEFSDLQITGTGGDGRSSNTGVMIGAATLTASGNHTTARISIDGSGQGSGSANIGVSLNKTAIHATGTGRIDLDGEGSTTGTSSNVGLKIRGGEVTTSGGGRIDLDGTGHGSGASNRGIAISSGARLEVESGAGTVAVVGNGGAGISANEGVWISGSTTALRTVDGNLSVTGFGFGSKSQNRGVRIDHATLVSSGAGQVTARGTASATAGGSSNEGLVLNRANLNAASAYVLVNGTGGSGTSSNYGIRAIRAIISSNGGQVFVTGIAQNDTTGTANTGVYLSASMINADSNVNVTATRGAGTSSNMGIRSIRTDISSQNANVVISGAGATTTTGNSNRGIELSRGMIEAGGTISLLGDGGAGRSSNHGLRIISSDLLATGYVNINANAATSTAGSGNRGVEIRNSILSGAESGITAVGGGGTNDNEGLRIIGGSLTATSGAGAGIALSTTAQGTTTGVRNSGAFLNRTMLSTAGDFDLDATGGGGTSYNYGAMLNRVTLAAASGDITMAAVSDSATTKASNMGMRVIGSTLSGRIATINGTGGGGTNHNRGISVSGGSMEATLTHLRLTGTARDTTTGTGNHGAEVSRVQLSAERELNVTGTGGAGTNKNYGAHVSKLAVMGGDEAYVNGTGNAATTGKQNYGVFMNRTDYSADDEVIITGLGGNGTRDNQGVRVIGGSLVSLTLVEIQGDARLSTSERGNTGVFIQSGVTLGTDSIAIIGTGGGGTELNHGVLMNRRITAPGALINGSAGAGVDSEDETGDFF